jgi:hypothetical protein
VDLYTLMEYCQGAQVTGQSACLRDSDMPAHTQQVGKNVREDADILRNSLCGWQACTVDEFKDCRI